MKPQTLALALVLGGLTLARADISMPLKDNFYDKMGRGIANIAWAPAEIFDSMYSLNELEGPTVAWSKGLVQGTSRVVQDIGLGVVDVATSPLPIGPGVSYQGFKQPAYDSMVVQDYPPGDLINFY
ncbi:MAG: exosortase system-associated protein, TIGR04073 family [Verrucomicrobium sp.]|nr:exosortase system-associated protein, TIGR04073 family [Verrucomicrobium sp.]